MAFDPSTAPLAADYLVANLPAALGSSVQVFDGIPTQYTQPNVLCVLGWELDGEPATSGPNFQVEEDYTLQLHLRSFAGDTVSAARASAANVYNQMQAFVRTDPTLGGNVRVAWVEHFKVQQGPTDNDGFAFEGDIDIRCQARLRGSP